MKYKYLLEVYDILISEIQNAKMLTIEQITTMLQNIAPESYLIYQIDFIKSNTKSNFKIFDAIHNLHPNAPVLKKGQFEPSAEKLKWLPKIEEQLKIQDKEKSYTWNNDNTILYIFINCKLEELSRENLFLFYYNWVLKNELEPTKRRIKEVISNLSTKEQIHDFIHKKQSNIECFLNRIIQHINPESVEKLYSFSNNDIEENCFRLIYIHVEKLMRHIEKDYYKYLDKNGWVSLKTILETKNKIERKYDEIKSYDIDLQFDPKLMILIEKSFSKIMELKLFQPITYKELSYSVEFTTKLLDLIKNNRDLTSEINLKKYLLILNFNTLGFFDYYTDEIKKVLEVQETDIEKIKILYKYLKNTNQQYLLIDNKCNSKLPTAKKQITSWIEEEIYYLNQKRILFPVSNPKQEIWQEETKMLTGLSVPQLSYFFGLLIQTGILQPKTHRAIFRFIADHFKTKMADTISVDSLNSKYYNVETTTKNAVREKIIELLNCTKF